MPPLVVEGGDRRRRGRELRIELQRLAEAGQGLVVVPRPERRDPLVVDELGDLRAGAAGDQRLLRPLHPLLVAEQPVGVESQAVSLGFVGPQLQVRLGLLGCLGRALLAQADLGQTEPGLGQLGVGRDRLLEAPRGGFEVVPLERFDPGVVGGDRALPGGLARGREAGVEGPLPSSLQRDGGLRRLEPVGLDTDHELPGQPPAADVDLVAPVLAGGGAGPGSRSAVLGDEAHPRPGDRPALDAGHPTRDHRPSPALTDGVGGAEESDEQDGERKAGEPADANR